MISSRFIATVLLACGQLTALGSSPQGPAGVGPAGVANTNKQRQVLRVFLLAGQSNMEGQGVVDLDHPKYYNDGQGTIKWLLRQESTRASYLHLIDDAGHWKPRTDVWCRFKTKDELKAGPLDIGFTGYSGRHHIGPELQFGHVVGDAIDSPILIVKTAWGGKSLHSDFRPPSSGGNTGPYYQQMIDEYREAIHEIPNDFPELASHEPILSGFVWFQGWNDAFGPEEARDDYATNLSNLISDLRREFKTPNLPVIVGELGNDGEKASERIKQIRRAQREACTENGTDQAPIVFVSTTAFARPAVVSPNVSHGHHWYGNSESYLLIGTALGQAMENLIIE